MADKKTQLVTLNPQLPTTPIATSAETSLPQGPHSELWNGATGAAHKNTEFVHAHTGYLKARRDQSEALGALIDARIGVASRLSNLQSVLMAIEADKQQQRLNDQHKHEVLRVKSAYELEILAINHEENVARARQRVVIAERDYQAELRTRDAIVEERNFSQVARRHNAAATAQDAAADLARTTPGAATNAATDDALNILDHEIQLQGQRDPASARVLQNVRSRIKGSKS